MVSGCRVKKKAHWTIAEIRYWAMTIVNIAARTPPIRPIARCSPSIIDLILDIGAPSTLRVANSESRSERFINRVLKSTAMAMMTPNPRMAL